MTDTNKTPENIIQEQQAKAIRDSLTNTAFHHYNQLISCLKSLPIFQQQPGMIQAYLLIDSGMLWIKEMLVNSPIMLGTQAPAAPAEPVPATNDALSEIAPDAV